MTGLVSRSQHLKHLSRGLLAVLLLLPASLWAQIELQYDSSYTICQGDSTTAQAELEQVGLTCDYVLDLFDDGGDGWNGATIDVFINGQQAFSTTIANGSQLSLDVTVQDGDSIDLYWNPVGFDFEISFSLSDPSGNTLFFGGGPFSPAGLVFSVGADCGGPVFSDYTVSWSPASGVSDTADFEPTFSPTATTTYTAILLDLQGNAVDTVTVPVQVVPDFVLQATTTPTSVCIGDTAQLNATTTGNGSYTHSWESSSLLSNTAIANPTASSANAGQYTFEVTAISDSGCVRTATTELEVVNTVQALVTALGDTTMCAGDSTELTAFVVPAAGTSCDYTFTLTDAQGNGWGGAELQLFVNGAFWQALTVPNGFQQVYTLPLNHDDSIEVWYVTGFGGGFGNAYEIADYNGNLLWQDALGNQPGFRVGLTVDCGVSIDNYQYTWAPGVIQGSLLLDTVLVSPDSTTTYTVIASESACGFADTTHITVHVVPDFSVLATVSEASVCLNDSVFFDAQVVGGGSYSYSWNNANLLSNATISNPFSLPDEGGNFTFEVTVTSDSGCTRSATTDLFVSASTPVTASVLGDTSICAGDSTMLVVNLEPISGNTCTHLLVMNDQQGNGWGPGSAVDVFVNGNLVHTGTVANGNQDIDFLDFTHGDTVTLVYTAPFFGGNGQTFSFFGPGNEQLFASGPIPPNGLTFSTVVDCGIDLSAYISHWLPGNIAGDTLQLAPMANTTYTLVTADTLCGFYDTVAVQVAVVSDFNISVVPGDTLVCLNENLPFAASADTSANISYTWSPAALFSSPNSQFPTASFTTSGTEQITVVADGGWGCEVEQLLAIEVGTSPVPEFAIEGPSNMCLGDSVQLDATAGFSEGDLCEWILDLNMQFGFNWGTAFVTVTIDGMATDYTPANGLTEVIGFDVPHGSNIEVSFTPSLFGPGGQWVRLYDQDGNELINELPNQVQVLYNDIANCGGAIGAVYLYDWGSTSQLSDQAAPDPMVWPLADTIFTVTVTDSVFGCSSTDSISIAVFDFTPVTVTQLTDSFCSGNTSAVAMQASEPNGTWSGNGIVDSLAGTWRASVAGAGNHTLVYVLNDFGDCASSDTLDVYVNESPTAPSAGPVVACEGEPVVLTTSSTGTVEWYSDLQLTNLVATGDTFNLGAVTGSGLYWVIGVNGNCASAASGINYTVEAPPVTSLIFGNATPTAWTTETYSVTTSTAATFDWGTTGGTINSGQGSNIISLTWNGEGTDTLWVIETSTAGCVGDTMFRVINKGPNSIAETAGQKPLQVYPQPATDWLMVQLPEAQQTPVRWQIADAQGRIVDAATVPANANFLLPLDAYSPGVYVLRITGSRSWNQRIIVQPNR